MKYIKIYESAYRRYKENESIVNDKDMIALTDLVDKFILRISIKDKLKQLTLENFEQDDFNYLEIWDDLIMMDVARYQDTNNIYRLVDDMFKDKNDELCYSMTVVRNSLHKVINRKYFTFDMENKINKRLIEIFKQNPEKYMKYADIVDPEVKKALDYIEDSNKYNL